MESGDEDDEDEDVFAPAPKNKARGRQLKRRKTQSISDDEEIFEDNEGSAEELDEGRLLIEEATFLWFVVTDKYACRRLYSS